MAENLALDFEYEWIPFTIDGSHLTFREHRTARLQQSSANWWGPAVYKWQGKIGSGPEVGKQGILIGETRDLRQRIKQYISGTQERGNKFWRGTFLDLGEIYLWVLKVTSVSLDGQTLRPEELLASANFRLVFEQTLVRKELSRKDPDAWIVNARQ